MKILEDTFLGVARTIGLIYYLLENYARIPANVFDSLMTNTLRLNESSSNAIPSGNRWNWFAPQSTRSLKTSNPDRDSTLDTKKLML